MYNGRYNGKKHHEGDLDGVIERAKNMGCLKMMVTGSNLKESKHAIDIAKAHRECKHSRFVVYYFFSSIFAFLSY